MENKFVENNLLRSIFRLMTMDTVLRCIGLLDQFLVRTYRVNKPTEKASSGKGILVTFCQQVTYRPDVCQTIELVGRQRHCPALCEPRTYSSAKSIQQNQRLGTEAPTRQTIVKQYVQNQQNCGKNSRNLHPERANRLVWIRVADDSHPFEDRKRTIASSFIH